jgi:hypothetical protein
VPTVFCWRRSFAGASQKNDAPANINPNILLAQLKVALPVPCIHPHLLLYPLHTKYPLALSNQKTLLLVLTSPLSFLCSHSPHLHLSNPSPTLCSLSSQSFPLFYQQFILYFPLSSLIIIFSAFCLLLPLSFPPALLCTLLLVVPSPLSDLLSFPSPLSFQLVVV